MKALIIAEHDNNNLKATTAALLTAVASIADEIDVLVAGSNCAAVVSAAARISGVSRVLHADDPCYQYQLAEDMRSLVCGLAESYTIIAAAASTTGKNFMPRVAARLDVAQISEVIAVLDSNTFVRPIYAGNALATVKSSDPVLVLTVRTSAFEAAGVQDNACEIVQISASSQQDLSSFLSEQMTVSSRPELGAARIIVSGGRGLGSAENFSRLDSLADKLGAAIGASRAAVDAGYVSNDLQIGQTGKIVAPDLYIAIGISGAIQHLAGMKDSKVIVAINKDAEAPIFQVADYALVADLFDVLPALEALL